MAIYPRAFCGESSHRETVDCRFLEGWRIWTAQDTRMPRIIDTIFEQIIRDASEWDNLVAISNLLNEPNKRQGVMDSANTYSMPTRQLN